MVVAYWEIGRAIVEEEQQGQQRAGYGKQVIESLSQRLAADGQPVFTSKGDADYQQILSSLKKVVRRHEPGVKDLLAAERESS